MFSRSQDKRLISTFTGWANVFRDQASANGDSAFTARTRQQGRIASPRTYGTPMAERVQVHIFRTNWWPERGFTLLLFTSPETQIPSRPRVFTSTRTAYTGWGHLRRGRCIAPMASFRLLAHCHSDWAHAMQPPREAPPSAS